MQTFIVPHLDIAFAILVHPRACVRTERESGAEKNTEMRRGKEGAANGLTTRILMKVASA